MTSINTKNKVSVLVGSCLQRCRMYYFFITLILTFFIITCGDSTGENSKDDIRKLIFKFFKHNPEDFSRTLWYLDQEEKEYKGGESPVWKTLNMATSSEDAFKMYASNLAADTKEAKRDPQFRKTMSEIYQNLLDVNGSPSHDGQNYHFSVAKLQISKSFPELAKIWEIIGVEGQKELLPMIKEVCLSLHSKNLVLVADELTGLVTKHGGTPIMVALSSVYLAYDAVINIRRWWKGEITGVRCVKNIIDTASGLTGGAGGGLGAAALVGYVGGGPAYVFAGGIFGSIFGHYLGETISDRLTQWIFGIPKSAALEEAYNYLGVKPTDSNDKINQAYHQLSRKYHPDKASGKDEDFIKVQVAMEVIKNSRRSD
ncbi:uncharacterized protein LOC130656675 [Hydractinia symbiolongicarpus]|uniref:uncharacterized protein LOC130656675 n=1 Tax=Hydractinia symbiolongicarpus TaxID=13093 RepID=UPI00254A5F15|nr:uncharacterized protein LOC130656675 [Hydractinia symbiolongicarpus]